MGQTSAIIIAAGMGSRLLPLTSSTPKCMLTVGKETILQQQLNAFRGVGIENISVVRGHVKEKLLNDPLLSFFDNHSYRTNNVLASLFCAEQAIVGDVVISYSDILFSPGIVEELLLSQEDITVAVDRNWREQYVGRKMHPVQEAEKVILDESGCVVEIGKHLDAASTMIAGEFIGMLRLSPSGASIFRTHFKRCQALDASLQFQQAETLNKAYLTDFLQELIAQGIKVSACLFSGSWMEIDTMEDLKRARELYGG
jgi:choline kinase